MALNHETGEYLEGLGMRFVVATPEQKEKWAGSPFMEDAALNAAANFHNAGFTGKYRVMRDDFLVQTYPDLGKAVFLFQCRIAGADHISHYTWDFGPDAVRHLRESGMWPDVPKTLERVN